MYANFKMLTKVLKLTLYCRTQSLQEVYIIYTQLFIRRENIFFQVIPIDP